MYTCFFVCCRPQPNYRYYILDRNMQPCPLGVPGECHISGVGVSLGYAGQPQLTADRFLPNPFKLPGDSFHFDTMYKTGDILAWLPDGNQRILGRVDLQVKLRGFRVELPGAFYACAGPCGHVCNQWPWLAPEM
jgi:non-ribosomal peptide synthetase component F